MPRPLVLGDQLSLDLPSLQGWFIGLDASRALYTALGYRRLVWLSSLAGVAPLMDAGYRWFSRRRGRLGRWLAGRGE
ncbi:DCC1-like thiol-disulfide oxidoreductase family protein [Halomonas sp. BM-2019]|uniref:DCC1-like thiol-disulfide oxidoreductase family protein n=1 Tax=Halomonas sp. BM-2019 TaxID=2811227 RepID=UPI001B3C1BA0|nr:MAG: DUF393 domain-containing protein [Halomonas sp. BM-2019]